MNKIAIKVGYEYIVANKEELSGISLVYTGQEINGYPLYKGETFEDSQKLDKIFDSGKYEINRF